VVSNRFQLARVDPWEGQAGGWWMLGRELMFRCPSCAQNGGLRLHDVTSAGEVNASILCDCGWHEFATLDGWPAEWSKQKGETNVTGVEGVSP
jgi:hypothetical protein